MKKFNKMESVFKKIIDDYPRHNVADDALFYLAIYAQKNNDYKTAINRHRDVVELYPNGVSVIGKFNFRDEAKKQLRAMKIDILSRLRLLDYTGNSALTLLKEFQSDNRLPVTGKADKKTIGLLIKKSDLLEKKIAKKLKKSDTLFDMRIVYFGFMGFLLLFNILWGIRNISALNEEYRRAEVLFREVE